MNDSKPKIQFPPSTQVSIATRSLVWIVITIVATILLIDLLFKLGGLIMMLVVAWIITQGLTPVVDCAQRRYRIPRGITILFVYGLLIVFFLLLVAILIPVVLEQTHNAMTAIATALGNSNRLYAEYQETGKVELPWLDWVVSYLPEGFELEQIVEPALRMMTQIASDLTTVAKNYGTNLIGDMLSFMWFLVNSGFSVVMVLFFTFLFSLEKEKISLFALKLLPDDNYPYIADRINIINEKLGAWFRGQVTMCVIAGVSSFIVMSVLGVHNALLIAMITAMTELVPVVGPLVAMVPAVLLALVQSPMLALVVLGAYLIFNAIESNLLVPMVMQQAIGVSPLVVIIAMMAGGTLFGVPGIILSVPFAAAMTVLITDLAESHHKHRQTKQQPSQGSSDDDDNHASESTSDDTTKN